MMMKSESGMRCIAAVSDNGGFPTFGSFEEVGLLNHRVRGMLAEFLETTPNSVLATTPTALNHEIVGQDLSPYFRTGNRDRVFYFAGDLPYSFDVQRLSDQQSFRSVPTLAPAATAIR